MIGKITKGNGFAGLCSYVLGKDEARLIGGNMAARSPNQLAAEFRVFSQRNPQVQKPVEHISLSPSPGDRELDDQEWQALAQDLLDGLGMSRNQYIVVSHSDTEFEAKSRPHIHIIVNRVSLDGTCASSWLDFHACEEVIRQIEQKYELTPVASSWEVHRGAESTGQVRRQKREAELGIEPGLTIKRQIQDLCDAAMSDKPSMNQYLQRLKDAGVESRIKETRTGKIQGISYQLEGVAFPGNKLGKNYSWHGLQKLGIIEQAQEPPAPTPKPISRKSKKRSSARELEL